MSTINSILRICTRATLLTGLTSLKRSSCQKSDLSIMGCAPSRAVPLQPSPAFSCDDLISRDEYKQQAQNILSRVEIIPPLQRTRARLVGLEEENGTFWVYRRPYCRRENERRRKKVESMWMSSPLWTKVEVN